MFQLFLQPFKKCFDFQGRARRSEFWIIMLPLAVLYFAVVFSVLYLIISLAPKILNNAELIDKLRQSLSVQNVLDFRHEVLEHLNQALSIFKHNDVMLIHRIPDFMLKSVLASSLVGPHIICVISLFFHTFIFSLTVRRLHDTERSAAWILLLVIPVIGSIWFLCLMLLPGTKGNNKYGPDPRST